MPIASLPEPRYLPADRGHRVAWFSVGDEAAPPVLVLHGGPGGRSRPQSLNWFDGLGVRCIAVDQRGCGASLPAGACAHNTLALLVADIEALREHLGLAGWGVAGGSWGALLALAYAAEHPTRVEGLFLRSAFLGSAAEVAAFFAPWPRWLGPEGAARLGWPHRGGDTAGEAAPAPIPDPVTLLQHVLPAPAGAPPGPPATAADLAAAGLVAAAWLAFEAAQSAPGGLAARPTARWPGPSAQADPPTGLPPGLRIQQHYLAQGCFVDDAQRAAWLDGLDRSLAGRPVALVHGEADAVCAIETGRGLAARWPWAQARWVPGAGHDMDQPALRAALTATAAEWTAALVAARTHAAPSPERFQRNLR